MLEIIQPPGLLVGCRHHDIAVDIKQVNPGFAHFNRPLRNY